MSTFLSLLIFNSFSAAIGIHLERRLVERYNLPSKDYLRTHRALQRTILQRLDADLARRQSVFDEVIMITRKAFPRADIITRGATINYAQSAKYMPQVISVHTNFIQSDPVMKKRIEFADLLGDVGYSGVSNACQGEALQLLQTGESICTALLDCRPAEVRPVLGWTLECPRTVSWRRWKIQGPQTQSTANRKSRKAADGYSA